MRGHSLVELVFVLLMTGVAVSTVAPAARRQRDRTAVIGAREAVVGLLAEARSAAMESGAAKVRVTVSPPRAELIVRGSVSRTAYLDADFGIEVSLGGTTTAVELAYDALGIGRVASQTISLRRGGEVTELVVSAHGRVRRR
jgi:type II secretory pathway pseudopilin PulG